MINSKIISTTPDAHFQLDEVRRELDAFLYRASHDLKGPLARMEGLVQLMSGSDPGPEVKFSIKLIETLTLEMQQVINDIIHVQDLFNGDPTFSKVNPQLLLDEVINGLASQGIHAPTQWHIEVSEQDIWYTDRILARMIFEQLLKNAFSFRRSKTDAQVSFRFIQEDGFWVIEVRDNGIGIQAQHIDRIFELFFRGTDDSKGSGMGLYLVKKAVFQLNGKIAVESEPDHFSHFRISLPIKEVEK